MAQKKNRRNAIIAALAVLVVALAVGGTIAWLTASSHIDNTFTVGAINTPEAPPTGEKDPDEDDDDEYRLEGNIYEVFQDGTKIAPGMTIEKKPYIGIGDGSESSYIFAYVKNAALTVAANTDDAPYFTLGENWAPVTGHVTESTAEDVTNAYVSGLFVYAPSGVSNTSALNDLTVLVASATEDVYTNPVFSSVVVPDSATKEDFAETPKITVGCYIYAAEGADFNDMFNEVTAWANHVGDGPDFIE